MDLEKAFDRVPREVIRWAMHKLGVEEWLVSAIISIYTGAKTVVGTVSGNSSGFEVKVGMHQDSALSPLLFVIVMEAISREFRVALPWQLLYADNLDVIPESEQDLIKRLNEWKNNVENRGMRVNINTTRPASADRTARRQFQATGTLVGRTQASDAMTSRLPRHEAKCVQHRCFQCGSVPLRSDIKGMELPPADIQIPLERQLIALQLCH